MSGSDWVRQLFQTIDRQDADEFSTFLSDGAIFRFANAPTVEGKANVRETVRSFFASIKGIRHDVLETWEQSGAVMCHGVVTYTRHDSSTLTAFFANVFKMEGRLIKEYLIFVDASGLYAAA